MMGTRARSDGCSRMALTKDGPSRFGIMDCSGSGGRESSARHGSGFTQKSGSTHVGQDEVWGRLLRCVKGNLAVLGLDDGDEGVEDGAQVAAHVRIVVDNLNARGAGSRG